MLITAAWIGSSIFLEPLPQPLSRKLILKGVVKLLVFVARYKIERKKIYGRFGCLKEKSYFSSQKNLAKTRLLSGLLNKISRCVWLVGKLFSFYYCYAKTFANSELILLLNHDFRWSQKKTFPFSKLVRYQDLKYMWLTDKISINYRPKSMGNRYSYLLCPSKSQLISSRFKLCKFSALKMHLLNGKFIHNSWSRLTHSCATLHDISTVLDLCIFSFSKVKIWETYGPWSKYESNELCVMWIAVLCNEFVCFPKCLAAFKN